MAFRFKTSIVEEKSKTVFVKFKYLKNIYLKISILFFYSKDIMLIRTKTMAKDCSGWLCLPSFWSWENKY